jgi:hypothetical protein
MVNVLKLAKQFDVERFAAAAQPQDDSTAAADACPPPTTSHTPVSVAVMSADGKDVKCTLTDPHKRFAACSCDQAVQQQMCHHQVAWLLQHSRDASPAERLIYKKLGRRFGFVDGCSFEGIEDLWVELQVQAGSNSSAANPNSGVVVPLQSSSAARQSAAQSAPQSAAQDELQAAVSSSVQAANQQTAPLLDGSCTGGDHQVTPAKAQQPASMSDAACKNHIVKLSNMFGKACEQYLSAAPVARVNLGTLFESNLANVLHMVQRAVDGDTLGGGDPFQKTGDGKYNRKRSHLERRTAASKNACKPAGQRSQAAEAPLPSGAASAPAAAQASAETPGATHASVPAASVTKPAAAQGNFAHRSQLNHAPGEVLKTKAWNDGRTAREAAQHRQAYHNQEAARAQAQHARKEQAAQQATQPTATPARKACKARAAQQHANVSGVHTPVDRTEGAWEPPSAANAQADAGPPRAKRRVNKHSMWNDYEMLDIESD